MRHLSDFSQQHLSRISAYVAANCSTITIQNQYLDLSIVLHLADSDLWKELHRVPENDAIRAVKVVADNLVTGWKWLYISVGMQFVYWFSKTVIIFDWYFWHALYWQLCWVFQHNVKCCMVSYHVYIVLVLIQLANRGSFTSHRAAEFP